MAVAIATIRRDSPLTFMQSYAHICMCMRAEHMLFFLRHICTTFAVAMQCVTSTPASGKKRARAFGSALQQRVEERVRHLQAELKTMTDRCKEKDIRAKKEGDAAARELRTERSKNERFQQQALSVRARMCADGMWRRFGFEFCCALTSRFDDRRDGTTDVARRVP